MIVIQKDRHGVTITGHAGYEEPGKDLVCAAVSVLVQTLAASAKRLTADRLEVEYRAGFARISYNGNLSETTRLLMNSFFIGIRMIACTYPDYVRIVQAWKTQKATEKTSGSFKNSEGSADEDII